MNAELQIRIHGDASLPTLVYLPGMHGDWTLVSSFRAAIAGKVRFVEFTYPQTLTWSLDDHAAAIEQALLANGIRSGWLLGESFGSQLVWPLVARAQISANNGNETIGRGFQIEGIVLANGFVRHPAVWGVRLARLFCGWTPAWTVNLFFFIYGKYAWFRHRHAPETLAGIEEFLVRRRTKSDRQAGIHRLCLIANTDLRRVARRTTQPVYYLAGLVDPIVFWPYARWWLKQNCPGYRVGKTIWRADHNVLGTAPRKSAQQTMQWISAECSLSSATRTASVCPKATVLSENHVR